MEAMAMLERCRAAEEDCKILQARLKRLELSGVRPEILTARREALEKRKAQKDADEQTAALMLDYLFGDDNKTQEVLWSYFVGRLTYNAISLRLHLSTGRIKSIKAAGVSRIEEEEAAGNLVEILDGTRASAPPKPVKRTRKKRV